MEHKKFSLLIILLTYVISISAETSKIASFYGMKLGSSRSEIEIGVQSQGKTGEWKYDNSRKLSYYRVAKPKLGSVNFDYAYFYIVNDRLSEAKFINIYQVSDYGEDSVFLINVEEDCNRYQKYCQENYDLMKNDLESKYGKPSINYDDKCVWQTGTNRITLQNRVYTRYDEMTFFGSVTRTPVYCYEVSVVYTSGSNQSNF